MLPTHGLALAADTRSVFLKSPTDVNSYGPYDNTWKIYDLGRFGVGAYSETRFVVLEP